LYNSSNPFDFIKTIESSEKLIDIAFNKAMKIKPSNAREYLERKKTLEMNRINTVGNVIVDRITNLIESFPSLNLIHPFYYELTDILVGIDKLKEAIGRVHGINDHIRSIAQELNDQILGSNNPKEITQLRKIAFGRYASFIKKLENTFSFLNSSKQILINFPGFDPTSPTVVITGIPNAGKSSFIRQSTSGKPQVASYPFTTKKLLFGHRKVNLLSIQFVDTPGILDRPLSERNSIEKQALIAIRHLADLILFFIDPLKNDNESLNAQLNLIREIKQFYASSEFKVAISKSDLVGSEIVDKIQHQLVLENIIADNERLILFNSNSKEGITDLIDFVEKTIMQKIIKSNKFKQLSKPIIAEDQLPIEDDPIWEQREY